MLSNTLAWEWKWPALGQSMDGGKEGLISCHSMHS
jgi:hypothetical protein